MKVVILAGGLGSRLSEETNIKPKPMVEIGGKPILWHIMKMYSAYGFNEFIVCLGYKGYVIKEYFSNYFLHQSDITIKISENEVKVHKTISEPWTITLIDTGLNTKTGGRLKRIKSYIKNETFMLTYGDGLSNVDITKLLKYHKKQGKYATVTAVQPRGRFGAFAMTKNSKIKGFKEKPKGDNSWINGGFFVLEPQIFDFIKGDETLWEQSPMENLAKTGQIMAYKHKGFWMCMDTLRDKNSFENLWQQSNAPWKVWDD